jgi:hypothetical protein
MRSLMRRCRPALPFRPNEPAIGARRIIGTRLIWEHVASGRRGRPGDPLLDDGLDPTTRRIVAPRRSLARFAD